MCEMDDKRRNVLANISLMIGGQIWEIRSVRKAAEGLRLKDLDMLDKLYKALTEAAEYLADELEVKE